jgi:hypothetical protein
MTTYDGINQHNLNLDADRFTPEKFGLVLNCWDSLASLRADMDTVSRFQQQRGLRRWVCGRSLAGIVGSNPAGGMDVCLLWVLCVVR